jgi:hypothetical protein
MMVLCHSRSFSVIWQLLHARLVFGGILNAFLS